MRDYVIDFREMRQGSRDRVHPSSRIRRVHDHLEQAIDVPALPGDDPAEHEAHLQSAQRAEAAHARAKGGEVMEPMRITPDGVSGYMHGEAFALMLYECKICGGREVLWNSRDGVTPFGAPCRNEACNQHEMGSPMLHIVWKLDKCAPAFKPWPGMRIFRDGTVDEARDILRQRFDSAKGTEWERPQAEVDAHLAAIVNVESAERVGGFTRGWPMIELVPATGGATK